MMAAACALTFPFDDAVEERHNEQLWRSATNGTESHTSSLDEFNIRQLLYRDAVEALERGTDKDSEVPMPSMGKYCVFRRQIIVLSNQTSQSILLQDGSARTCHLHSFRAMRRLVATLDAEQLNCFTQLVGWCIDLSNAKFSVPLLKLELELQTLSVSFEPL